MFNIDHILVVMDPEASHQRAMQRGIWLAQRFNAQLELFVCDYDPALANGPLLNKTVQRKARATLMATRANWLEELAAPHRKDGLEIDTDVQWGKPLHDEVTRKSIRSGTDLVLKATEYQSKLRRTLFTNSDWQLIRECPAPIWFVKLDEIAEHPNFIAAIDPMSANETPEYLNEDILAVAAELQQNLDAKLHVANWMAPSIDSQMGAKAAAAFRKLQQDRMNQVLQKFTSVDVANVHLAAGRDYTFLLELVNKLSAQLVLMGSVARGRMQRLVLGSTAEHMLDQLRCDVLVVKADDFLTPVRL